MKTIIVTCLALTLGATMAGRAQITTRGGGGGGNVTVEARAAKGMPYSAEISSESIQTLADGNRIVRRSSGRVYRDSEGRVRRETEDIGAGPASVTISDPVAGKSFSLNPAARTVRETPSVLADMIVRLNGLEVAAAQANIGWAIPPGDTVQFLAAGGRGRGSNSAVEEKLPDRFIEGVVATGVRRTTTIEKGAIGNDLPITIVSEEWTSPDLQVLVLTDLTDPRTGHSTYKLLHITRGEPDPALFQVPADYTLVPVGGARGRGRGQ